MNELKYMIDKASINSLILADELCSGTEINSALSILYSSIKILIEKKTNFIFTSHIHEIMEIPYIKNNDLLKIQHIKITIDNNKIIFNRKLSDNSGPKIYGLEIAKTLNFPNVFIKDAFNLRNSYDIQLLQKNDVNILSTKKSRYNSNLFVDSCYICNCSIQNHLEVHHINEQKNADDIGFINHFHKNKKFNLIVLCNKCHDNIHDNKFNNQIHTNLLNKNKLIINN